MSPRYRSSRDIFLEILISEFVEHGVQIPITMSVGGTIISGYLVSEDKYFEEMSKLASESESEESAEVIQEAIRAMPHHIDEAVTRLIDEGTEGGDAARIRRRIQSGYIHLIDSSVETPGGDTEEMSDMLWRGRLEAVDGFWLGFTD